MAADLAPLAEACLSHLARAGEALRATLGTLAAVRAAVLAADAPRLQALRGEEEALARRTQALREEREALRARIAGELGIPPADATLEPLAARVGGEAGERLLGAGLRVRELATRVDALNRSNAAVLRHCLGFTRRALRALTGGGTPPESYDPDGMPTESPCASLLSARG